MGHHEDTPHDLTCEALAAFVMDYIDGALPAADRTAFEAHLAACEDCIVYLRGYRATIALEKAYGAATGEPPPAMPEDLVQAILAARRGKA